MPIVQITYAVAAGRSAPAKSAVAEAVAGFVVTELGKKPELIATIVHRVDPEDWFVAGSPLSRHGLSSLFVDISVTDGTNTKAEKAAFIAAVFAGMEDILGPLHPKSYIHVHDVRADAYGYGGLTQEYRFVAATIASRRAPPHERAAGTR